MKGVRTVKKRVVSIFLAAAMVLSVSGVTASNVVVVSPAPASFTAWGESGVYASAQAAGKLTFTAAVKPTAALTANVLCIN